MVPKVELLLVGVEVDPFEVAEGVILFGLAR